jgi:hypothetical protein
MDGTGSIRTKYPLRIEKEEGEERAQERGFGVMGVFCLTLALPTLGTYLTLPT